MTDTTRPDPAAAPEESCWRLAWLRTGGAWRSALVTVRRRPGPGLPWIVYARWGEDKDAAWVIVDDAVVRPLPQTGDVAATQSFPAAAAAAAGDGAVRDEAVRP
ncbi:MULTISPECIES: hypothetical protein [unclassified Kitasatospora]|uniref:hypothetical protein n=1 Tax=unclassified Kitasatospora TaxID=2633591 RepID=UPI003402770D